MFDINSIAPIINNDSELGLHIISCEFTHVDNIVSDFQRTCVSLDLMCNIFDKGNFNEFHHVLKRSSKNRVVIVNEFDFEGNHIPDLILNNIEAFAQTGFWLFVLTNKSDFLGYCELRLGEQKAARISMCLKGDVKNFVPKHSDADPKLGCQ